MGGVGAHGRGKWAKPEDNSKTASAAGKKAHGQAQSACIGFFACAFRFFRSKENPMGQLSCDPGSGVCAVPATPPADGAKTAQALAAEVVYVGDPLCSWCWAAAPVAEALAAWCAGQGLPFSILMGGLRPGGGDPWNAEFKAFLRRHWQEIETRCGRPFGFALFDRPAFRYDSLPPCRAVAAARQLLAGAGQGGARLLAFYAGIQKHFFVDNADTNEPGFYEAPCAAAGLDFAAFLPRFADPESEKAARKEFALGKALGVDAFPSFVLKQPGGLSLLSRGYASFDTLAEKIAAQLSGSLG
jgi:putative protein-disulfide isomerase